MKKKDSEINKVEIDLGEITLLVDAETTMLPVSSMGMTLAYISLAEAMRMYPEEVEKIINGEKVPPTSLIP